MNEKVKAGLIGIPLLGAVAGALLLLVRAPLFLFGAIGIVAIIVAGYHLGLWLLERW